MSRWLLLRSSPATFLLAHALMPSWDSTRFAALYTYFRVLDDTIDRPPQVRRTLGDFVDGQYALLHEGAAPGDAVERGLQRVLDDTDIGRRLRRSAEPMFQALGFDASGDATPLDEAALDAQIGRIGDAYAQALWVCSGAAGDAPDWACVLARAATHVHLVRDLQEDLALGYVNVPGPEASPSPERRRRWARQHLERARAAFATPVGPAPRRTRWLFWLFTERYARLGLRIEARDQLVDTGDSAQKRS